ncbi:LuxR C-terminal-related transcriptional regulator [Streptomyces sp. NPDC002044]|uniref:response regulator transcription factor n=1 Tax=Streptomyces sp. NPDC002044 TaxID=3154662 RepID=UPI00332B2A25
MTTPPASIDMNRAPTTDLDERSQGDDLAELTDDCHPPAKPHRWHEEVAKVTLLSDREFQVFRLLGNGSSNRGIARNLRITERTAKAHMSQIMAKLGVESRLQAGLVSYTYQLAILYDIPHFGF